MTDYLILMFDDATDRAAADDDGRWADYIAGLHRSGQFDGGSAIGRGERVRKGRPSQSADTPLNGYLRVRAASLDEAKRFLVGNPAYEAGASVEVRELPKA